MSARDGKWQLQIQVGPNGEESYAWVFDAERRLVCVAELHHAQRIVDAINRSIVHKDEIHAPSVERAIAVALAHIQQPGMTDNPAYVHFEPADAMAKKIAAALRELMKEVGW